MDYSEGGVEMAKLLLDKVKDEALILKLRTSYNLITEDINHTQTVVSLDNLDENVVTDIINLASGNKEMMLFETSDGWVNLNIYEINYLESYLDQVYLHDINQQTYILKTPLYQLEERLSKHDFVRISISFICNIKYIRYIKTLLNQKLELTMMSGDKLIVTRSYLKNFKNTLML